MGKLKVSSNDFHSQISTVRNGLYNQEKVSIENYQYDMESNSYLVPFLNVFYYFLLVPYRMEVDKRSGSNGKFLLKIFRLQQIFCGITHVMVISLFLYVSILDGIQLMITSAGDSTLIVEILQEVGHIASLFIALTLFNMLWRKHKYLLELIESARMKVSDQHHLSSDKTSVKLTYIVSGVTLTVILLLVACVTSPFWLNDISHKQEVGKIVMVNREVNSLAYISNTVMYIISAGYVGLVVVLGSGFILCITLELGKCATLLTPQIENSPGYFLGHVVKLGLEKYVMLTKVTDLVRDHVGGLLLPSCISAVSYYAQAPHVWDGHKGNSGKLVLLIFGITIYVWITAAEFHYKVHNAITAWIGSLMTDYRLDEQDMLKLMYVSNELSTRPVALSCKYFSVTYGYLGSMLGMILTYGVIVFQLNHNNCNNSTVTNE